MINKKWYDQALSITKNYGIKLYFYTDNKETKMQGCAIGRTSSVYINTCCNKTKSDFFTTLFHEIGHVHCFKNDIWKVYHKTAINNVSLFRKYKMTAYKAECWVDKWGQSEMKKHMPNLKYTISYEPKNKEDIEWLQNFHKHFYVKINSYLNHNLIKNKKTI